MGDEVVMVCWSQAMKGLAYSIATSQVRAEAASCRVEVASCSGFSKGWHGALKLKYSS